MRIDQILEKIETDFKGQAIVDGVCRYLTGDGRKCAIGLFIPDYYDLLNCDLSIIQLLHNRPELKKYMPSDDISKLSDFQFVHDKCTNNYLNHGNHLGSWSNERLYTLSLDEQKMYLQLYACSIFGID